MPCVHDTVGGLTRWEVWEGRMCARSVKVSAHRLPSSTAWPRTPWVVSLWVVGRQPQEPIVRLFEKEKGKFATSKGDEQWRPIQQCVSSSVIECH